MTRKNADDLLLYIWGFNHLVLVLVLDFCFDVPTVMLMYPITVGYSEEAVMQNLQRRYTLYQNSP